uniref:Uncharacterized protein n=1 Tax=viral metagenome TaxID=1070528 RepID=A0A6C0I471_9ZZZZ
MSLEQSTMSIFDAIHEGVDETTRLIDAGVDVNSKDEYGRTPLHEVVSSLARIKGKKGLEIVRILLQAGADVNSKDEEYGRTPLHLAIDYDKKGEITKLLIDSGAHLDIQDNDGDTPLHSASRSEFFKSAAKILIDSGAKVDIKNNNGDTPLHIACIYAYDEDDTDDEDSVDEAEISSNFTLSGDGVTTPYVWTGITGTPYAGWTTPAEGKQVYTKGPIITDFAGFLGLTGLTTTYHRIEDHRIKMLIDSGAKVNIKNNNGCTPLHYACEKFYYRHKLSESELAERIGLPRLLVSRGANLEIPNDDGDTPLDIARKHCVKTLADILLETSPDWEAKGGKTKKRCQKGKRRNKATHRCRKIKRNKNC